MKRAVRRHAAVEDDILELASFIAKSSREQAFRFLDAAEGTVMSLRHMPGRGSPKMLPGRLGEIRSWAVRGFPHHLVLYEIRGRDVYVFAVVHGSRSYQKLLRERLKGRGKKGDGT
jgi:plasmid stabilization system protein ParE